MKKKTPLAVLTVLEKYVDLIGINFERIESGDDILRFKDKDAASDFHFYIKKSEDDKSNGKFVLSIQYAPQNKNDISTKSHRIYTESLENTFSNWIKLLQAYDSIKSPFDDPIFNHHYESYFSEFTFVDDQDSELPLTSEKILLLDDYLEKVSIFLEENKLEDEPFIEEIQKEITEIRKNLGRKSKKWIAGKLAWVWGKVTMVGPKLMKGVVDEGNKRMVKEAFDNAVVIVKNLLENPPS